MYFVNCVVLFIKYGNHSNIISILIIVLEFIFFIIVFVRFYFYPDPADYFRYSFRKSTIGLSHYYIKIIFLLLTSILISAVLNSSFAALVPCVILLIYTLAYRPYQDTCENVRAAFNLLVMCAFCGLRLYTQYISSEKFNEPPTYLCFVVCFMLLFLVVFVGFIMTIYYFHYYKYRLPMLVKEQD